MHGNAVYTDDDGGVYTGLYANDKRNGKGKFVFGGNFKCNVYLCHSYP